VKRAFQILAGLLIAFGAMSAHAQRVFSQPELDALLAPIALYPDPVLDLVLDAAQYPDDVQAAAAWSRANPQLNGDAALAVASNSLWQPSVKALVAYPDILQRMAESPQWLADLGEAAASAQPDVQSTIQELRARAQNSGYLRSDANQSVYQQDGQIAVQPVYPSVVYVPYYDPYIVYGPWWWTAYRPVYWRPWAARPVIVTRIVQQVNIVRPGRAFRQPFGFARPGRVVEVTPFHRVPESQRQPIIQSAPAVTPSMRGPSFTPGHIVQQHMPSAQSAPIAPVRAFTPARLVQRAQPAAGPQPRASAMPAAQPRASAMPAPQVRASEGRFNRVFQSAHGNAGAGGTSNANRGGGRRHN